MKRILQKLTNKCNVVNLVNVLAFAVMISSVNSTCWWIHHQPEVPNEAKRYRKF